MFNTKKIKLVNPFMSNIGRMEEKILRDIRDNGYPPAKFKLEQDFMEEFKFPDNMRFDNIINRLHQKRLIDIQGQAAATYVSLTIDGQDYIATPWIIRKLLENKDIILVLTTLLSTLIALVATYATLTAKVVIIINGSR